MVSDDYRLNNRISRIVRQESSCHQKVISRLVKRLRTLNPDSKIFRNLYYENCATGERGECDLVNFIGFYNGNRRYALVFEVKTSRKEESIEKAISQLEKSSREVRAFYGGDIRCFNFLVYSSNNYFRNPRWSYKPYKIRWIKK